MRELPLDSTSLLKYANNTCRCLLLCQQIGGRPRQRVVCTLTSYQCVLQSAVLLENFSVDIEFSCVLSFVALSYITLGTNSGHREAET